MFFARFDVLVDDPGEDAVVVYNFAGVTYLYMGDASEAQRVQVESFGVDPELVPLIECVVVPRRKAA